MPAPPAELVIPGADEVKVGSYRQDVEPQTPVTPVLAEAFMSLQNLIIQQDAYALDETRKQNLARHLQKSSTLGVLQEDLQTRVFILIRYILLRLRLVAALAFTKSVRRIGD
jgi:hypothetical protein